VDLLKPDWLQDLRELRLIGLGSLAANGIIAGAFESGLFYGLFRKTLIIIGNEPRELKAHPHK
jgi:hypothetical protein